MAVMPTLVLELVLDYVRALPTPDSVLDKEKCAKTMLSVVLVQRSARKELVMCRAQALGRTAQRERMLYWRNRCLDLEHRLNITLSRVRGLRNDTIGQQAQEVVLEHRVNQAVLRNLMFEHPELHRLEEFYRHEAHQYLDDRRAALEEASSDED